MSQYTKNVKEVYNSDSILNHNLMGFSADYDIESWLEKLPNHIQDLVEHENIGTLFVEQNDYKTEILKMWACAYSFAWENDYQSMQCFLIYDFNTKESYFLPQDIQKTHEIFVYRIIHNLIEDDEKIPVGVYNDFNEVYRHLDYGIHHDVFINMENGKITRTHKKSGIHNAKYYRFEIRARKSYKDVPIGSSVDDIYMKQSIDKETPRPFHFMKFA